MKYHDEFDASLAILSINKFTINAKQLRSSFGRSGYCFNFLNGKKCQPTCTFVHENINLNLVSQQMNMRVKMADVIKLLINKYHSKLNTIQPQINYQLLFFPHFSRGIMKIDNFIKQ